MLTLGIETAGQQAAIVLCDDDRPLGTASLMQGPRAETNRLVLLVQDLCQTVGVRQDEVDLVAVNLGPGSFTGLRVGLVFAKLFAYLHGCGLKGIDSFSATLARLPASHGKVECVEDLRQSYVAAQRFQSLDGVWQPESEIRVEPFADWSQRERTEYPLTGGGVLRLKKLFPDREYPAAWTILPEEFHWPDAVSIARLGRQRFQHTGTDDPFLLMPLYLRRSAAEEKLAGG